ncbi:MAG: hypothetical protein IJK07_04345 [Bacteroidales bacterium]|nr:hypothetical protein [Bacteroidales bacterium]
MINIVVYGKPRAFESHEYGFDVDKTVADDNSFQEPLLKPQNYDEPVLHYFSRSGYSGMEYYSRVNGFESERGGIVFGIALKTNHEFDAKQLVNDVLYQYRTEFAELLLTKEDDWRFKTPSVLDILKGTKWPDEDISIIKKPIRSGRPQTPNKKLCLLYAPEFDQIFDVEQQIKEYEDVYISSNSDIFKDPINNVVLKLANKKIYKIKDDKIVDFHNENTTSSIVKPQKPLKWGTVNKGTVEQDSNESSSNDIIYDDKEEERKGIGLNRKTMILLGIVVSAIILLLVLFLKPKNEKENEQTPSKTETIGGSGGSTASGRMATNEDSVSVTFKPWDQPINESCAIIPTLNKSPNSSIISSDINYSIDHTDIVKLEKIENENKYKLKVLHKPDNETVVTVVAEYKGTEVGRQQYIIARKPTTDHKIDKMKDEQSITILYNNGQNTSDYWFPIGGNVEISAVDKNKKIIKKVQWHFPPEIKSVNENTNINPITISLKTSGTYSFSVSRNGTTLASSQINISK